MELSIRPLTAPAYGDVEIVEHKGIGHPDTICDALAEALSVALSRDYLERFGAILHHNVDKALLFGGASRPAFGGGEILEPMEIFLAGRATRQARGLTVPVEEMVIEGSRRWLKEHLHALDPERHVKYHSLIRPGSADLVDVYLRKASAGAFLANDTSCGAGYAPLSDLERTVQAAGSTLRALSSGGGAKEIGEDYKVMGVRRGDHIRLTVACAFIGRYLRDVAHYAERRAALAASVGDAARRVSPAEVHVDVNTGDDLASGAVYLTVTGTSAEAGDDGQVGRGNRVNGLIAPYRPMTLEAAAGKNPVSHVGKLYNVAAHWIAAELLANIPELAEVECYLVSQIGRRIDDPEVADLRVRAHDPGALAGLTPRIEAVVRARVAEVPTLYRRLLAGELSVV